ncbi:MAG: hypothetical protein D6761_01965 [Candidatus Dadabacteria bacterium]|nr:MAG: hypothetical protein D6761_01965 [Candidatus Dadabacteria bacterium]
MSTPLARLVWRCIWPSWYEEDWMRVRRALQTHPPGGVTLFSRHLPDPEACCDLNRQILLLSHGATRVAVDQEGGPVQRLPEPLPRFPAAASWAIRGENVRPVFDAHCWLGELLRRLGFAIDFAPVADLEFDPDHAALRRRCFGGPNEPSTVARVAAAVEGLRAAGLEACAKHFPGHGAVASDSHVELDVLDIDLETAQRREWIPFRAAIASGVQLVMVGHFRWPAICGDGPTTFSRPLFERLRGELGFAGVIVSDDLEMGAIARQWAPDEAALLALTSGQDVALFCHRFETAEQAAELCIREAERSAAFRAMLHDAAGRIERLRQVPDTQRPDIEEVREWLRHHPEPWIESNRE